MHELGVLDWPVFESSYLRPGVPARIQLLPVVFLDVAAAGAEIVLSIRTDDDVRELTVPAGLSARFVMAQGQKYLELTCSSRVLFRPFFSLCLQARDLVSQGVRAASAIETAFRDLRRLLSDDLLNAREAMGLFGELVVLEALATMFPNLSAACWTANNPDGRLHDFRLGSFELEVKSTSSTRRAHWVSSVEQMSASEGSELYLVSVQLQAAGDGGGRSIADLVSALRRLMPLYEDEIWQAVTERCGGDVSKKAPYRWLVRSGVLACRVDKDFPAITAQALIEFLGVGRARSIGEVKYLVDVSELENIVTLSDLFATRERVES